MASSQRPVTHDAEELLAHLGGSALANQLSLLHLPNERSSLLCSGERDLDFRRNSLDRWLSPLSSGQRDQLSWFERVTEIVVRSSASILSSCFGIYGRE